MTLDLPPADETTGDTGQVRADIDASGVTIYHDAWPVEIGDDWAPLLEFFGLDPTAFAVVDDQVRIGKHQQSKRIADGSRDVIWLYSYRARFTRRTKPLLSDDDVEARRRQVRAWEPRRIAATTAPPSTFLVCWADWQIGKSGTDGAVERITASFDRQIARLAELRKLGRNVERIQIALMGDPIEGCDGNYASQLATTIPGGQRAQLRLALDLYERGVEALAPHAPTLGVAAVLSNHGEWTRRGPGMKPVTSDSDSADGHLVEELQRVFRRTDYPIEWVIPHDQMTVTVDLSGVRTALTHGHKITGKREEWLRGQSIRLLREQGAEPRLWVTAHKHHGHVVDHGPWWDLGCPSEDDGSKWYTDSTGWWAHHGTLTALVGSHDPRGFSDLAFL